MKKQHRRAGAAIPDSQLGLSDVNPLQRETLEQTLSPTSGTATQTAIRRPQAGKRNPGNVQAGRRGVLPDRTGITS
jgi:hypothetical protein